MWNLFYRLKKTFRIQYISTECTEHEAEELYVYTMSHRYLIRALKEDWEK